MHKHIRLKLSKKFFRTNWDQGVRLKNETPEGERVLQITHPYLLLYMPCYYTFIRNFLSHLSIISSKRVQFPQSNNLLTQLQWPLILEKNFHQ